MIHKLYRSENGSYFACRLSVGTATEGWERVTCPDCLAHKAPPVSPPLDYALASLRRAAEHGYPWSVSPSEAAAVVEEVDRLRKQNRALQSAEQDTREAEQGAAARDQIVSLLDGFPVETPCPEAARVAALLSEVNHLRAKVFFLHSSVPPWHPSDYGHEAWMEQIEAAEARGRNDERAHIVADLRSAAPEADRRVLLLVQNPIALTLEACAERYERGDHAARIENREDA